MKEKKQKRNLAAVGLSFGVVVGINLGLATGNMLLFVPLCIAIGFLIGAVAQKKE